MPKVMRQVEQEVGHDVLNADLAAFAETIIQKGAFIPNADGTPGERINNGDCLVPTEQTYSGAMIAPDTHVYVIRTFPEAGIVWGVFHRPDGTKAMQFFVPQSFASKHVDAPVPARAPTTRIKATKARR